MPTTVEEYHAALEAFKTQDPNGNGKADEIPLSFRTDSFCANPHDLVAALGGQPENNDHRIVRDGKVQFTASTDEYRAGIEGLSEWYSQGLIDPESFSQDDVAYLSKGKAETPVLGSFFWWELEEMVGDDRAGDYAMLGVLEGVDGERLASVANNQEISRGAMAITRANAYPAATMRWADRLYDPVMSAQASWGPLGVTLEEDADGMLVQIPAAEGESEGERRQKVAPGGPKITTAEDFETVVAPEPRAKVRQDLVEEYYAPYAANEAYPPVLLSTDEPRPDVLRRDRHQQPGEGEVRQLDRRGHRRGRVGRLCLDPRVDGRRRRDRDLPAGLRPLPAGRRLTTEPGRAHRPLRLRPPPRSTTTPRLFRSHTVTFPLPPRAQSPRCVPSPTSRRAIPGSTTPTVCCSTTAPITSSSRTTRRDRPGGRSRGGTRPRPTS